MFPTHKRAPSDQADLVWRTLFERQTAALERGMCAEFKAGVVRAGLDPAQMPRHAELSKKLYDLCGWRIETVPGLIPVVDFFTLLQDRRFPSPEWIRHPDNLEYTPEPDAFHDLFGHVPQLVSPAFTNVLDRLASAARGANAAELVAIERVYWFTIEFGLVHEGREERAFGAGLASSIAELNRALNAPAVDRRRFVLSNARTCTFEKDRPQDIYMIADSLDDLALDLGSEKWVSARRAG